MEPVFRTLEILAVAIHRVQGVRVCFTGLEHIPERGGAVIAINHTGYVDFLPAALGLTARGRRARFLIKSEVMDLAIMRFLVKHTGTVPVDRSAGADAFATAVAELRDGECVAVYPESTISRSFELKEFKTGAVRMAATAGVPVIPAIVWGAHRQWTKGGPRGMGRRRIPILVEYGPPLEFSVDENPEAATARLRQVMTEQLYRVQDRYPEHPAGAFWVPARLGGGAPTPEEAHVVEDAEAAAKAARRAERARREADRASRGSPLKRLLNR